ncbi:DUF896 domain-containing protein [Eubacteriales bacterium OttesenSCG-928-N13]|nr:DUF896 domain-containing protein [Eubacteriales bacterium OttesenSCG-928-N13]
MEMQQVIDRINALTQISRERDLTEEEDQERQTLRAEYMKLFKANFRQQLDSTYVQRDDGEKVPLKEWHKSIEEDIDQSFPES